MKDPVLEVGSLIADRYRIAGLIARGGMGAVHAAVDERLQRDVALKTLRPELVEDPMLVARFEREAQTAARLGHPSIAQVFDFGTTPEGLLYLVMERVRGETLAALLKREGRLAPSRAADIVEQALGALASAHAAGVVHRDLKPGNMMIVPTGESREVVKLLDFGIAHLMSGAGYTRLTQTGIILGTPTYMSPEQALGEPVDVRTDVYAMGVLLWCLLTGRKPFEGANLGEQVEAILKVLPPLADELVADVPNELARVAQFAMQKDRERRFVDANAMGRALVAFRTRESMPMRAPSRVPEAATTLPMGITQPRVVQAPQASAPGFTLSSHWPWALGALALLLSSCLALGALGLLSTSIWATFVGLTTADVPMLGAGGVNDTCRQARRCCETYAGAVGAPTSNCALLETPGGERATCEMAVQQYASGLQLMRRDASMCVLENAPTRPPPGGTCLRTMRCCQAYLRLISPSAITSCDAYAFEPRDAACNNGMNGFRAGLRAMGRHLDECE